MTGSESAKSGGISTLGLLGVVLITLKLCGVIDWSWWWVTSPFWGWSAVALLSVVVVFLIGAVVLAFEKFTS